jgi:hypothetical protein
MEQPEQQVQFLRIRELVAVAVAVVQEVEQLLVVQVVQGVYLEVVDLAGEQVVQTLTQEILVQMVLGLTEPMECKVLMEPLELLPEGFIFLGYKAQQVEMDKVAREALVVVVAVAKTVSFALMELETPVAEVEAEVKVVQEAKVDGVEELL